MIKVNKISSLDGLEIDTDKLVTFEDGVLINNNNKLTFDVNSGLHLERINCDTQMIVTQSELEKDKEYILNQEIDENPFIRIIPTVLFQPSDEIIDPSMIRLSIDSGDDFTELIPTLIETDPNGSTAIYDSLEINTNSIKFKVLSEIDIIANVKLEVFSY